MSSDDWDVFREMRSEKQRKRNTRANAFDSSGWSCFPGGTHFHMMLDGYRVDHWPSSNKWLYKGRYYRGSAPKIFLDAIEAQRQENIKNENPLPRGSGN